ncbi:TFIIB-type zinc ribbon-containing protein [Methanobrevibacter boviskoreani]|uniref:TFIIB-type zinc ribbon-containing protein n=1 Tax=Methanobrevibacter boviskoreani TaxID=1348249 RepID=UPI003C6DB660
MGLLKIFLKKRYKRIGFIEKCPNCKNNDNIFYDEQHDEILCLKCGAILIQNYTFYYNERKEKKKKN